MREQFFTVMHDRDHLTVERCAETAVSDGNSRHHTAYYLPKQQAPSKSFPNAHIIVYQEFRRTFFGNLSVHCCGVRPRDEQSATLQTIRFLSRLSFLKVKVKVNYTLEQATKAQRESRCIALLFLQPRRSMGVGGRHHAQAALPPRQTGYQLYRRLSGPQGRSRRVLKISHPPGFDPRTFQPAASRYTD